MGWADCLRMPAWETKRQLSPYYERSVSTMTEAPEAAPVQDLQYPPPLLASLWTRWPEFRGRERRAPALVVRPRWSPSAAKVWEYHRLLLSYPKGAAKRMP